MDEQQESRLIGFYEDVSRKKMIVKFVPASGAASRMFKNLFGFLEESGSGLSNDRFHSVGNFFEHIKDFAFYEDLKDVIERL